MPGARAPETERKGQILEAALRVAMRDRLEGLSTRKVAREAGLSHGLVFFHFATRERLLVALLDWLLQRLTVAGPDEDLTAIALPVDRLFELLRRQIMRWNDNREQAELFFDFWVVGTRHPEIRDRIRAALQNFRDVFHPLGEDILAMHRLPGVSAEGIAALALGILDGCALQLVMDPERFHLDEYLVTTRAVLDPLQSLRPVPAA